MKSQLTFIFFLLPLLFISQTVKKKYNYSELTNKRKIILTDSKKSLFNKKILENSFIGIKKKNGKTHFGRIEVIYDNYIAFSFIEEIYDTVTALDTTYLDRIEYSAKVYKSLNLKKTDTIAYAEMDAIYLSKNHQALKYMVGTAFLVGGVTIIFGGFVQLISSIDIIKDIGIAYYFGGAGLITLSGAVKLNQLKKFKEYRIGDEYKINIKTKKQPREVKYAKVNVETN